MSNLKQCVAPIENNKHPNLYKNQGTPRSSIFSQCNPNNPYTKDLARARPLLQNSCLFYAIIVYDSATLIVNPGGNDVERCHAQNGDCPCKHAADDAGDE